MKPAEWCSLVERWWAEHTILVGGRSQACSGTVTLDDAPFSGDASVVLMCLDTGQAGSADIQPDGTFRLEKRLPVGAYVAFIGPKSSSAEEMGDQPVETTVDEAVPKKYRSETTTDITIDIVEGKNDVAVAMKK